ncbi:hypothetical protein A2U01_0021796, partial [Trifolium medium]|nr:hypothetical protein [Trifolium medium]
FLFKNGKPRKLQPDVNDNGENVVNQENPLVMDLEPEEMDLTLGDEDRSHLELEELCRCKAHSYHHPSMFLDSESSSAIGKKAPTIVLPSNVDEFDWVLDDIIGVLSCFPTTVALQDAYQNVGLSCC